MQDENNNPGFGGNSGTGGGSGTTGGSGNSSLANVTEGASGGALYDILEKIGVSSAQIDAVRGSLKDANVEETLEKARTYVNDSLNKARDYAKANPGVVIGGLAALVVGAGLLAASVRKDKE